MRSVLFVGFAEACTNVIFVCTVEYRCHDVPAQSLGSHTQMHFQNLSDVHTGRYAQRVQDDVQRCAVRQERHIFFRQNTGNDTLVTVTACHLVADRDLTLLCDVAANQLVYARREFVAVFAGEDLDIHDNTSLTVGHLQGVVADFASLFAEDCTQQAFFCGQFRFALRGDLTNQNIAGMYFRTDADNTVFVQILQGIVAHVRNVAGDFFRSQLGVTALDLQFFNVHGSKDIFSYQTFVQQNGVLVVVAFPCHEADQSIFTQRNFAVCSCRTVCQYLSLVYPFAGIDDRTLVDTGRLVGTLVLLEYIFMCLVLVVHQNDLVCGNGVDDTIIF